MKSNKLSIVLVAASALAFGAIGVTSCTSKAHAQVVQDHLSWKLPATRTDGSALAASELAKTTIQWGPSGGPYTQGSVDVQVPLEAVTLDRTGAGIGTRCYVAFVTTVTGVPGLQSAEACKTVEAPPAQVENLRAD